MTVTPAQVCKTCQHWKKHDADDAGQCRKSAPDVTLGMTGAAMNSMYRHPEYKFVDCLVASWPVTLLTWSCSDWLYTKISEESSCGDCDYWSERNGECRKNAPTGTKWPKVTSMDWCYQHKWYSGDKHEEL